MQQQIFWRGNPCLSAKEFYEPSAVCQFIIHAASIASLEQAMMNIAASTTCAIQLRLFHIYGMKGVVGDMKALILGDFAIVSLSRSRGTAKSISAKQRLASGS